MMCILGYILGFVLAYLCSDMSSFYVSTAEAVLQKMDDMEKMCRRRMMEDLGVFRDTDVDTDLFHCAFVLSIVFHVGKSFSLSF